MGGQAEHRLVRVGSERDLAEPVLSVVCRHPDERGVEILDDARRETVGEVGGVAVPEKERLDLGDLDHGDLLVGDQSGAGPTDGG